MSASDRSRGGAESVDHAGSDSEDTVQTESTAQLEVLQERLAYKDELVAELTARLEEAAEQLDRLQRSGVRPSSGGGAGLPADLVDEQRQLTQDLASAVREWQEMNAAVLLSQIDARLRQLQDQLASPHQLLAEPTSAAGSGGAAGRNTEEGDANAVNGQISDAWEAMKARLLSGEETSAASASGAGTPAESMSEPVESAAAEGPVRAESNGRITEAAAPEPVDLDTAQRDELVRAVMARDEYIAYLLQVLSDTEQRIAQNVDWTQFEQAPEALTRQLQEELERITERGRREELRLSLERARLSREQAKLDQLRAVLERRLRMPGSTPKPEEDSADPEAGDADRKARWSRLFGAS